MTKGIYYEHPKKMRVAMCLVYPDSAPADWLYRLRNWHIPAAISPVHDKDTWDSDKYKFVIDENGEIVKDADGNEVEELVHAKGDYKKKHYHVMLAYGNATTEPTFMKIINDIGGVIHTWDHMEVVSVSSMYRYFSHMDEDPEEKVPYDPDDIVLLGGFDPDNYLTWAEKQKPFSDVMDFILNHKILNYGDLCLKLKREDTKLFYFACSHTIALEPMIRDLGGIIKRIEPMEV